LKTEAGGRKERHKPAIQRQKTEDNEENNEHAISTLLTFSQCHLYMHSTVVEALMHCIVDYMQLSNRMCSSTLTISQQLAPPLISSCTCI